MSLTIGTTATLLDFNSHLSKVYDPYGGIKGVVLYYFFTTPPAPFFFFVPANPPEWKGGISKILSFEFGSVSFILLAMKCKNCDGKIKLVIG